MQELLEAIQGQMIPCRKKRRRVEEGKEEGEEKEEGASFHFEHILQRSRVIEGCSN